MRILVVEDDQATATAIRACFEDQQNIQVFLAFTVKDALNYLDQLIRFDVVFLDYIMDTSVDSLVSKLKQAGCRIILMTAAAHPEQIAKQLKLDELITKPFDLEKLIAKVL